MDSTRILIAMNNEATACKLKGILVESGYIVVEQANDGNDCIRKIRTLKPDLAIIEYTLPAVNGLEISKMIMEECLCDVILITSAGFESDMGNLRQETGFVCISKPLSKASLVSTIDLMERSRRKIKQLNSEIEQLRSSLDTRKEVEKAKGLLMKYLNLSEAEAFKRIQRQSMDRGIAMKEIAKAIILAYDI